MGFGPAPAAESNPETEALAEVPELSLEQLDQFLETEDPEFTKKISGIAQDKSLTLTDIDLANLDEALYQETQLWRNASGWRYYAFRIFPGVPSTALKLKKFRNAAKTQLLQYWSLAKQRALRFATEDRAKLQEILKQQLIQFAKNSKQAAVRFFKLPLKVQIIGFLFLFLFVGTIFLAFNLRHFTHQFEKETPLYVQSFSDVATDVYTYDPENAVEPFYENLRSAPNLIYLEKIVVNLKPSANSSRNPMAAFELFLEGLSPEVVIEVKQKETMLKDHIQRETESYTFDELDSTEGKKGWMMELSKSISKKLSSGKLKSVRIKTFIMKP